MAQTRELRVAILGDAKSARRALSGLTTQSSRFGQAMRRTGVIAGAAIVGIGVAASRAAIEAEKATAQTEAVLKSTKGAAGLTAREIQKLSTEIMGYSGMSDEAVQSAQNLLLTFTAIQDQAGDTNDIFTQATKTAADMSVALGTDMRSAVLQLGKALQDPVRGITALRRVGVNFNDAQQEQINKLVESNDLLSAQKMILAELSTEFGGSARALGQTTEGQFNIVKESIGNVLEEIGGPLNKLLVEVLPQIAAPLGKAIKSLLPVIESLLPVFKQLLKAALPVVKLLANTFAKTLKELMPALKPLIKILGDSLIKVLKELAPVLPPLARAFTKIMIALMPLIEAFANLTAEAAGLIAKIAGKLLEWAEKYVVPALKLIAGWVKTVIDGIAELIGWLDKLSMKSVAGNAADFIKGQMDAHGIGGTSSSAGQTSGGPMGSRVVNIQVSGSDLLHSDRVARRIREELNKTEKEVARRHRGMPQPVTA